MARPPFKPYPVHPNAHPLVQALFREMNERRVSANALSQVSGVNACTIRGWASNSQTTCLQSIEAALETLGFNLSIKRTSPGRFDRDGRKITLDGNPGGSHERERAAC